MSFAPDGRRIASYAGAAALAAGALGLLRIFEHQVGPPAPLFPLLAAVVVAALVGGLGPGLVAAVLALVGFNLLFHGAVGVLSFEAGELIRLALFAAITGPLAVGASELRRTRAEAMLAERRASFLAEAGVALAAALDVRTTLDRIAQLAVPRMADWCFLHLAEPDGTFPMVAVAHPDESNVAVIRELDRLIPVTAAAKAGPLHVFRTGTMEVLEDVPWSLLSTLAVEPVHLAMLRRLKLRAYVGVPLVARGQIIGVLSFAMSRPQRFDPRWRTFARELAGRAALAIDNARLYEQAQAAVRARDEFLSIAAHELKTPLTGLTLQVDFLRRSVKPQELAPVVRDRVEAIARQVKRLTGLITNLLDLSRITSGQLELHPEPTDAGEVLRAILRDQQEEAAAAGCALEVRIDEDTRGHWDRMRLEQVALNLVSNALKYGRGAPVEVSLLREKAAVVLTVRDHGRGIAPADQARIFERFARLREHHAVHGFGLGLWITRQIVEAFGGTLRVESRPGEGARFIAVLPDANAQARTPEQAQA